MTDASQKPDPALPSLDAAEEQGDEARLQALEGVLARLEDELENDGLEGADTKPT